ncbi:MAG: transcriptional regulator, TetR family protein [Alphaproteobacteria bacterium]|jgi:hypothetical protein|nr:transcriptional regulator, TetR family protein [Alphaproteobacteria bacterium]MDF3034405.1 transcriptional regulator, TetR family protein [Alphaproteobacteria bacterium]
MNEGPAIWKLASEGGMAALTIDRLAKETGRGVLELESLYPDPSFMVLVLMEEIHNQTMSALPAFSVSTSPHDRLTDMVMAHLDACLVHRQAIRRLWGDLMSMPLTLLALRPYLMKMVARILKECGVEEGSLWGPIRLRAYFAFFLYVFYVWIYDDTPQQEQTLVSLDRGLKQLGALPW